MTQPNYTLDYTRVSDDTAILCRRRDFPRAVNILERRSPDHRRWRQAFQRVVVTADRLLEGPRRRWMEGALQEVVTFVPDRSLRTEIVLDAREHDTRIDLGEVLPRWSARDLWKIADSVELPMEYLATVTSLPRAIDAPIDTARVVLDCRQTSSAHRNLARQIATTLPTLPLPHELDALGLQRLYALRGQQDAADRWRLLSQRLLGTPLPSFR